MRPLLSFFFILISTSLFAQHDAQEIKKFKISKIIMQSVNTDAPGSIEKYENRYDNNGNEIATYIDGQQFTKLENQYNPEGKLIKTIEYAITVDGSEESSVTVYTYNQDGTGTAKKTYNGFDAIENKWYNKNGQLIKTVAPDKIEDIYTYDAAGKLLSVKTKPGTSDADVADMKYTYNAKGQRTKEISAGSYPWTRTYTYDAKGILVKRVTVSSEEGITTTTTDTYKYEFLK